MIGKHRRPVETGAFGWYLLLVVFSKVMTVWVLQEEVLCRFQDDDD